MLAREIAARARKISWSDAPSEAVETAKQGILDTIGVTLAGASEDSTACLQRAIAGFVGKGESLILGSSQRVDPLNAALINGTASHALDFDDCSNSLGGHPSAPILPGLWALAESRGAGGGALLSAYIAGVEVETKIARAVNFHHYEKGWHPTATLGTFGAAAACAHLLQLDAPRYAAALAIAASMASGLKANFGTMTKPFHVGHTSRNGLLAALLAEEGLTANEASLEAPQGFFSVFNGEGNYEARRILDSWASPLDLVEPGIAFKRHPCCGSTNPAADAMLVLRQNGLKPEDVDAIECWTHPRRLRHTNRPKPTNGLDGKFSVQYVVARALLNGVVSLDHFTDEAIAEPAAVAMTARVHAAPDPDASMETTDHFYARLRVRKKSGEVVESFIDRPVGRDRNHPLPPGALEAKFLDCAGQAQDEASSRTALAELQSLERVERVSLISDALAAGALSSKRGQRR